MKHVIFFFIALMCVQGLFAQRKFNGLLLKKSDSTGVAFAAIKAQELNEDVMTDENGAFSFSLPKDLKKITFNISAIGCKTTLTYHLTFDKKEKLYVDVDANPLSEVAIKSLSAVEVVKMAVNAIPDNYADSNYCAFSNYRRYQKLNGRYVNLYEAQPAVMFRLSKSKKRITAKEAFAVKHVRSTKFYPDISNEEEDNPSLLLPENPVYHLEESSLYPSKLTEYAFNFDTSAKSEDYVINYISNRFSSETHGMGDYAKNVLKGEIRETGTIVIDRKSFAIKKYHRVALRHKDYLYRYFPPYINLVSYAYNSYFFEFVDGELIAEYAPVDSKWYLSKLAHRYSCDFNDFYLDSKEYSIEDFFEWSCHAVSRYVTGEYVDQFYPKMIRPKYEYDSSGWNNINFPFYFKTKDTVYRDLVRDGNIEDQFTKGCKENNDWIYENARHHK